MNRGQKIADITPNTPVIAVMMSNSKTDTLSNTWKNYKTTVRHIEQSTGYNFFQDIPKTTQDILETTINTVDP
jgi:endonuclease G